MILEIQLNINVYKVLLLEFIFTRQSSLDDDDERNEVRLEERGC